ncbi:MAG: sigma-54 dependent transcriptional regulator, partial [Myxococcota bacterium]
IFGESGTGKELVADALHATSSRAAGPLIKLNCAAIVEGLVLSELFGHERGAFTGAYARKQGRFELADGGTLFLDEIGDISPATQIALLRVLQEGCFERVGGNKTLRTDVRVVGATHRDLRQLVREGRFREDLYYRLSGVTIEVPALRERKEDLEELCVALLARSQHERAMPCRVGEDALATLADYPWPGNVRELENTLRTAALFAESSVLCPLHFGAPIRQGASPRPPAPSSPYESAYATVRSGTSLPSLKKALERQCIERALAETDGNVTRAAELLGMKRPRVSQLVHQFARQDKELES